jgi:CheY-like chemotaxis protein
MTLTAKILVIDDEPINLSVISYALAELNLEITKANSGEEALLCYRLNQFDLVITDFNMPRKNGKDVLEEIRKIDAIKNNYTPILLATAIDHINAQEYKKMGFDEVLFKPINKTHLLESVIKHLHINKKKTN